MKEWNPIRLINAVIVIGLACMVGLVAAGQALAGEADVEAVKVNRNGPGVFSFDVTVRHADTGWKHYANKWDIVAPDGSVLGTRILHHPHENEQPFMRSLSGVRIPASVKKVTVRAYDSKHGLGGKTVTVDIAH